MTCTIQHLAWAALGGGLGYMLGGRFYVYRLRHELAYVRAMRRVTESLLMAYENDDHGEDGVME